MDDALTTKILVVVLGLACPSVCLGLLSGSKHDFGNAGWNTKGACAPCHSPHGGATAQPVPLWSHANTQAEFELYDSGTMQGTPEQPRPDSRLCLSCHDGTVTLGAFGGESGSTYIGGDAHLGINLADDHPISFHWEHQSQPSECMHCHEMRPVHRLVSELPFYDGYLECSTCHDVHNGAGYEKMLRKPAEQGQLCRHCHW